jgi:hypothetical protein
MKTKQSLPTWFKKLLRDEGLDDFDQFFEPGYFDETPLYSRYDQLDPLGAPGAKSADSMLFGLCLDYLVSLLEHRVPECPFFAALTMTRDDRRFPMVPAIFACCGEEVGTLPVRLPLTDPRSSLGDYLGEILDSSGRSADFEMLQDSVTVPRHPRIFISRRDLPSPRMLRLSQLARRPKRLGKQSEIRKHSIGQSLSDEA